MAKPVLGNMLKTRSSKCVGSKQTTKKFCEAGAGSFCRQKVVYSLMTPNAQYSGIQNLSVWASFDQDIQETHGEQVGRKASRGGSSKAL